ncbi:hypothetical protein ACTWQJ_48155, partial [Streptomyces sp. KR55]
MVGAAVGAVMNRRDTRKIAARIRADLRKMQVPWDQLSELPPLPPLERPADALSIEKPLEEPGRPGPNATE